MLSANKFQVWENILQAFGPSGNEELARRVVIKQYRQYTDEIIADNLGSTFAVIRGNKNSESKKVMLLAHIDEVGFMVRNITDNGFIEVEPLGGIWEQTLLAKRVVLQKDDNTFINGVFSAISPHLLSNDDRNKVVSIPSMLVDFGFVSKADAISNGVSCGQFLIVKGETELLANRRLLSKAIDDRMGVILGLEILEWAQQQKFEFDLYIGFSVQEEVGSRGAQSATTLVNPDLAIIVDVSPAQDYNSSTRFGQLGKGTMLRGMDRGYLPRKMLIDYQKGILQKNNIKNQFYISPGSTDAAVVHRSNIGVPTIQACLIARNLHSPASIIDLADFDDTLAQIKAILLDLTNDKIEELKPSII